MNKETEELIIVGVLGFILLSVLTSGQTAATKAQTTAATLAAGTDQVYANDTAGLIASLASDFTS